MPSQQYKDWEEHWSKILTSYSIEVYSKLNTLFTNLGSDCAIINYLRAHNTDQVAQKYKVEKSILNDLADIASARCDVAQGVRR